MILRLDQFLFREAKPVKVGKIAFHLDWGKTRGKTSRLGIGLFWGNSRLFFSTFQRPYIVLSLGKTISIISFGKQAKGLSKGDH